MRTFNDKTNTTWSLRIDCGTIKKVLSDTGINLGSLLADIHVLDQLFGDVGAVINVLWCLVEKQASLPAVGVTREEFETLLEGEAFQRAHDALYGEWQDFFRRYGRTKEAEIIEKARSLNIERIETVTNLICGARSTKSPEPSASTQTASASAS